MRRMEAHAKAPALPEEKRTDYRIIPLTRKEAALAALEGIGLIAVLDLLFYSHPAGLLVLWPLLIIWMKEAARRKRERIRRCAERAHLKEAVYIRGLALSQKKMTLPEEAEELLGRFLKLNLSVGQNINQAARSCREKGSFSADQYRELTNSLEKLNHSFETLNERILEVIKENGDHETAPP